MKGNKAEQIGKELKQQGLWFVTVEVDRIPWPVGGVSSKITGLRTIWGLQVP